LWITKRLKYGSLRGAIWYVLKVDPNRILNYDKEEFHQIRWFSLDEIPFEKTDPHMKRFIKKAKLIID
jgi:8-oxo-dGTP diphosphatase